MLKLLMTMMVNGAADGDVDTDGVDGAVNGGDDDGGDVAMQGRVVKPHAPLSYHPNASPTTHKMQCMLWAFIAHDVEFRDGDDDDADADDGDDGIEVMVVLMMLIQMVLMVLWMVIIMMVVIWLCWGAW